jgi:hypothetical protein
MEARVSEGAFFALSLNRTQSSITPILIMEVVPVTAQLSSHLNLKRVVLLPDLQLTSISLKITR